MIDTFSRLISSTKLLKDISSAFSAELSERAKKPAIARNIRKAIIKF